MARETINGVPIKDILRTLPDYEDLVERVAERKVKAPQLDIEEPDPRWPEHFETFRSRILAAFGHSHEDRVADEEAPVTILAINHIGSTSVAGLPAKAVIDIDLVLSSNLRDVEPYYVPRLEAAGFQFLLREPAWYEHRFFYGHEPMLCNLHVFGPGCAEVERHRIFRDWLREHEDDRDLYAKVKRECAAASRESGEGMRDYTARKNETIEQIRMRAFRALSFLDNEP